MFWTGSYLRLSDRLMYSTVKINTHTRTCGAQIIGTGFVLKYFRTVEDSIPVFVSNRHVIEASLGGEILMHRSDRNNNVIPGNIPLSVACYIFASC